RNFGRCRGPRGTCTRSFDTAKKTLTAKQEDVSEERNKLFDVRLDDHNFFADNPEVEHERRIAISDLLQDNRFEIVGRNLGPYALRLNRRESRLIFEITADDGHHVADIFISLLSFRKIIRDYFTVCESYYEAIKTAPPAKIQAIDMGRRGLHNEGADLLKDKLSNQVDVDDRTARRLFTLICVLHVRV
ncbi:MAG: UPF0262 family protein, partial [Pseudomonadota bacterium]|nr:UPF0262 family protein [Pseudomonadota bacterium]